MAYAQKKAQLSSSLFLFFLYLANYAREFLFEKIGYRVYIYVCRRSIKNKSLYIIITLSRARLSTIYLAFIVSSLQYFVLYIQAQNSLNAIVLYTVSPICYIIIFHIYNDEPFKRRHCSENRKGWKELFERTSSIYEVTARVQCFQFQRFDLAERAHRSSLVCLDIVRENFIFLRYCHEGFLHILLSYIP